MLEENDYRKIVEWNKGKDADFLYQWAGPGYVFPISEEQIAKRLKKRMNMDEVDTYTYKVLNKNNIMLGTIELFNIDRKKQTATIARFLIDENYRGRGLGEKSLRLLLDKAFTEFDIDEIDLRVFSFNEQAISCYEKVGFVKTRFENIIRQTLNDSWGVYEMKIKRRNDAMSNKTIF